MMESRNVAQVFRPEAVRCLLESPPRSYIAARAVAAMALAFVAAEPQNHGGSPRIYAGKERFSAPKKVPPSN